MYLAIKNQIFNRHSMPLSVKKISRRIVGFHNTFYTKCINVIIDSIGPSIIMGSILVIPQQMFCQ